MDAAGDISLMGTAVKTVAMLALVLGCVVLVIYLMRRFMGWGAQHRGDLEITRLGAFYFSPRERIEVMEISGERIVLGVTSGRISYIKTLRTSNEYTEEK